MDPLAFLLILPWMTTYHRSEAVSGGGAGADVASFVFNGFLPDNLTTDGSALVLSNGLLQLTNHSQVQKGHALYSAPIRFRRADQSPPRLQSFSTTFVFAIVPKEWNSGTHGMAFVVSSSTRFSDDSLGANLGLFNSTNMGNASNHIFAVEFDLVKHPDFQDIDENHVGVDINGLISVASQHAGYYASDSDAERQIRTNLTLPSGEPMQLWVDFDAATMLVEVTLAPLIVSGGRPKKPLLTANIANRSKVFLDTMHIGFSGATGKNGPVAQYVLGWSFQVGGGPPPQLDLRKLPMLPKIKSPKQLPSLFTIILPIVTAVVLLAAVTAAWLVWQQKKKFAEILDDWEIELYRPHRFSYKDLCFATKGFSETQLLGTGGFGAVYRGLLPSSGVEVAVKRVSHESRQGIREFVAEIVSIGRLRHRNLVQLLGYCRRKGELLLVYDYMPNGSLDTYLFEDNDVSSGKPSCTLDWDRRFRIVKGVGAALRYLHQEWEQVVIHRDVKSSNVLLDRDLNGRLGDFGLARLYDHGTLPRTTHVVGTMGYIAPDLTRRGKATEATDVFAFGVFLLEVVCGRRPIEPGRPREEVVLVDWVLGRWMKGAKLIDCLDRRIRATGDYNAVQAEIVLKLGLLCSHARPESRPSMKQVMEIMDGDLELPELSLDYWSSTFPSVVTSSRSDGFLTRSSASTSTCTTVGAVGDGSSILSGGR